MPRLCPGLPPSAPARAARELRRWAKAAAGPTLNVLRMLCNGWVTDSRFGREVRGCPWCQARAGHRLSHLLACPALDRELAATGIGWKRQTEAAARLTAFLWGSVSVVPAVLILATDAAHYVYHARGAHSLRDLLRARVRALLRRHPKLATAIRPHAPRFPRRGRRGR